MSDKRKKDDADELRSRLITFAVEPTPWSVMVEGQLEQACEPLQRKVDEWSPLDDRLK